MDDIIRNEDKNVIKAHEHLKSVLVEGETIETWAIQRQFFAWVPLFNGKFFPYRRILAAATSGRFIVIKRGIFGGFKMRNFRWQDLGDVDIYVGIFGADLFIKQFASTDLAVNKYTTYISGLKGLRKKQAQEVYRLAQAHEQSWREKRRVRAIEELRAKSGGVNLSSSLSGQPMTTVTKNEDLIDRLEKAKDMLDKKLISDSEYETIKARIISEI